MKILIANYEYPPLGGGAGVCTQYHAEGLAARGHEVTVLTAWFPGEESLLIKDKLRICRVNSKRKYVHKSDPIEMLSWVKYARAYFDKELAQEKWDLVLANFAIPGGMFASYAKKKYHIPYFIISHGQDIPWFFPRQLGLFHALLYFKIAALLKGSVKNIMLTQDMKRAADRLLPKRMREKNVVIPNGCHIEKFCPEPSMRSDEFKIIFTGRLRQQKDPITFLRAVKLFAGKNIPFEAFIIGDGPMRKQMEAHMLVNDLSPYVSITGWVDKERMLNEYRSASVLVSTSRDEGMSVALLEAISTGLYIIATPASGNRDMITENINGNIIPFKDPEKLADTLANFYQEKFVKGYAVDTDFLATFRNKYSWDAIVDQYHSLITSTFK
jgi:glycosyltransferase involved in cell wall biosynthesis